MDVTPTPKMFAAMSTFVDATVGEAPTSVETTSAAKNRRKRRRIAMDFLHNLVRLSMREGVARDRRERGMPTAEDKVRPNPLKSEPVVSDTIIQH